MTRSIQSKGSKQGASLQELRKREKGLTWSHLPVVQEGRKRGGRCSICETRNLHQGTKRGGNEVL